MLDIGNEIVKRFDELAGQRGTWEDHWTEIAERVLPRYADSFNAASAEETPGQDDRQYSGTCS